MQGPGLVEVYDDADYIDRTLDAAEEAYVELYHAMSQLLTRPWDSLAVLQHLPAGVAALITSSPEYLERFRYMTRGEQVKAVSKLTTSLIVTFGAAGGTTRTLTGALGGVEATVPVLSLSTEGALVMERVMVPVGQMATVLSGGPGAAIILQQAGRADTAASETPQGQMRPDWKSIKIFQHTFKKHGQGAKITRSLTDTARGTGKPQGQWLDNEVAAELLQSHSAGLDGPASIRIPDGLGQVIMPDGSIVNATRATLVPGPNGFITAYPIP